MKPAKPKIPSLLARRILSSLLEPGPDVGMTGDEILFLSGETHSVLKLSIGQWMQELERQFEVLCWLDGRLPTARPLAFQEQDGCSALWMTRLPGEDASAWAKHGKAEKIAAACAAALLLVHSVDTKGCPFDARLDHKIALAEQRAREGKLDVQGLDEVRREVEPAELVRLLRKQRPQDEDLVFSHGDFCLPNIIFDKGRLSGFVDLGRAGVADRYQDLSLLLRSLKDNLGKDMSAVVAKVYGIRKWDQAKIDYYQLLDEFF